MVSEKDVNNQTGGEAPSGGGKIKLSIYDKFAFFYFIILLTLMAFMPYLQEQLKKGIITQEFFKYWIFFIIPGGIFCVFRIIYFGVKNQDALYKNKIFYLMGNHPILITILIPTILLSIGYLLKEIILN